MQERLLSEVAYVGQVRFQHHSRVTPLNLMFLQLQYGIDGTGEEYISAIWATITGRIFQHHRYDFHKVDNIVELSFGGLQFVHIAKLDTCLLNAFVDQTSLIKFQVPWLHKSAKSDNVFMNFSIVGHLYLMGLRYGKIISLSARPLTHTIVAKKHSYQIFSHTIFDAFEIFLFLFL